MSIATRTGDCGQTRLLFNRTVSKCHPRVEACGSVDELTSALGLARAAQPPPAIQQSIEIIQQQLIRLMGELAAAEEDRARFDQAGFRAVDSAMIDQLDGWIQEFEPRLGPSQGWALPGANPSSAALDFARSTCRRAERRVCALLESGQIASPSPLVYLNRLSDVLWIFARFAAH